MEALFSRITESATLLEAWERVEENAGSPGVDGVTVELYEMELEEHLMSLQRDLRVGHYRPLSLLRVYLDKPNGGRRPLSIPTVRDRVAQSAAALILTPILEAEFETMSFGYRPRRSVAQAISRVRQHREQGYTWVVDADIDGFFDAVDHPLLLARLRRSVADPDLLSLVEQWLKAEIRDGDQVITPVMGLPQGGPISPLLANLYLDRFDEEITRHGYKLVRFADDFLILCKEESKAKDALLLAQSILGDLRLTLEPDKTRITTFGTGFRYLGTLFVRSMDLPSPRKQAATAEEAEWASESDVKPATGRSPASSAHIHERAAESARPSTTPDSNAGSRRKAFKPADQNTLMAKAMLKAMTDAGLEQLDLNEAPTTLSVGQGAPTPSPSLPALPPVSPSPSRDRGSRASSTARTGVQMPFLRTLYIQEQGSVLTRHDERLAIKKDGEVLSEVIAGKIDQIYIFGNCSITTPAMTYCLKEEIPIVLFSSRGSYYGLVESPIGDHVSLHREQFTRAGDPAFCLAAAKTIVAGKLHNGRVLLQRHNRTRRDPELAATVEELAGVIRKVPQAATLEELHGQEGNGAARYFEAFGRLVGPEWGFTRRVRRPPTDPVNSLLSLGYTLLFYNVYALIRARGLHPYVGHLHTMRDRHPSLASDLMEEFRAPAVDSLVLYMLHSNLLKPDDFYRSKDESGPCLLTDAARKVFLKQFEVKMGTKITHPSTGYVADYRRCIDLQAYQMAQYIRGEIVAYQPMLVRY